MFTNIENNAAYFGFCIYDWGVRVLRHHVLAVDMGVRFSGVIPNRVRVARMM